MKRLSLHPACRLFPQLPDHELRQLADDIKANGLQQPIVLFDGKVLDRRNRLAACKLAGVKPRFVNWSGVGSPVEWVISQNLMRRHLTANQRAVIAHDLLPLPEKEAKQRQRLSKGRGKKAAKKCATFSENGKASEAAAQITRTNPRYVEMVKAIHGAAANGCGKLEGRRNAKRPSPHREDESLMIHRESRTAHRRKSDIRLVHAVPITDRPRIAVVPCNGAGCRVSLFAGRSRSGNGRVNRTRLLEMSEAGSLIENCPVVLA